MGQTTDRVEEFIAAWRDTGGSELANTQSFVNGLCDLIGVPMPDGSKADDFENDYVFERRVFAENGDGTTSFGRIDCYRRGAFILEAKQGSDADRRAAEAGEEDLDLFGQSAARRMKRGTSRRGTGGWTAAMIAATMVVIRRCVLALMTGSLLISNRVPAMLAAPQASVNQSVLKQF